jgi:hypothetical protein
LATHRIVSGNEHGNIRRLRGEKREGFIWRPTALAAAISVFAIALKQAPIFFRSPMKGARRHLDPYDLDRRLLQRFRPGRRQPSAAHWAPVDLPAEQHTGVTMPKAPQARP